MSDRSSPIFDRFRAGTAAIVCTEDSAGGMSSLCECFSRLIWTWETFLRELNRAGAPELDVPGDTAQQESIIPPAVTTWRVYRGKAWTSKPRGGERRKDATSLQNYLHPPASRLISFGYGRARGADDWNSAGRAREELAPPTSRAQTT